MNFIKFIRLKFLSIQNVINRHYSTSQVIIHLEQRFWSKFVKNDASCLLTSYEIIPHRKNMTSIIRRHSSND